MGFMFIFKRLVGMVAQPLPVVFFLLLLALLCRWRKWKKASLRCACAAAALLFITSYPPLVRWQAGWLEGGYRPLLAAPSAGLPPAAIVVLGNGVAHPGDGLMPALTRLNDTARARLVEGVRLAFIFPDAQVHVTGFGMGLENCADAMALAAMELGVAEGRIRRFADAMDTGHEAALVRQAVGPGRIVLVTTAVHMPRAVSLFRARGFDILPAPCDFIAPVSLGIGTSLNRHRWRPRGASLADSEAIWHEALGLLHQRLFGVGAGD